MTRISWYTKIGNSAKNGEQGEDEESINGYPVMEDLIRRFFRISINPEGSLPFHMKNSNP